MEVEHINDDTVRVYIRNEDLAARGFTFIDLLGGHREIESFFYSILEEIDVDDQFKGSEAVTFQVLPRGDGLELYITKDMNFDKMADLPFFQGLNAKTIEAIDESLTEDELEAIGYIDDEDRLEAEQKQTEQPRLPRGTNEQQMRDWVNRIKGETESIKAKNQQNKEKAKPRRKIAPTEYVFVFNDFEEVIQATQKVNVIGMDAKLYELEQQFYLVVTYQRGYNEPEHMAMQNAIFKEFAQPTHLTKDVLQEHGKVLFANDALMEIKKIFKG
ncbi:MAG TPA: adaptor protein MecA [Enterococcus columbae]|nr:adaptor protein MecA [Enterococcus columbae]